MHHQLLDVQALLQDEYEWIGRGRNDGDLKGEFSAIFYKRYLYIYILYINISNKIVITITITITIIRQVVSVVDWETFWLSEVKERFINKKEIGSWFK